jgi:hypothetical protein
MRRTALYLALLPMVVLTLVASGCGVSAIPQRYPSRPPAGMTVARGEQDERACLEAAKRAATERAWAYIGCMVSRGHTVGVAFHVGGQPTYMGVTQTRSHEAPKVATELEDCRKSAYAAGRAGGGPREAIVDRMEGAFRTCLDPLGYAVQRAGAPSPAGS